MSSQSHIRVPRRGLIAGFDGRSADVDLSQVRTEDCSNGIQRHIHPSP
jgi:hypothetical protein